MRHPNGREALLLSALSGGERYGLEIRDAYRQLAGSELPLGSLYTTLDRMEAKGYVRSRHGSSEAARGGNRRRYFRLTAMGERALWEWLGRTEAARLAAEGLA